MCFIISKDDREIKIAEKDIICYKILRRTKFSFLGMFRSAFYGKIYTIFSSLLCKEVELIAKEEYSFGEFSIVNQGYHSYINPLWRNTNFNKLVKCVIPKGSKYYQNIEKGEYVSSKLLVYTLSTPMKKL